MADPVISVDVPRGPLQPESRPQRRRFVLVYLLLGVVLAGAIAGLVVLLGKPGQAPESTWSVWRPEGEDTVLTQQIADFVAPTYKLSTGQQLVGIQAAPLQVQDTPIGAIVVRHAPPAGSTEAPIDQHDPGSSVVYILCGFGENCAITAGEPSEERMRLLRREALELALYTFRYVDGMDFVVAFLPPPAGDAAEIALFFRRSDFEAELSSPLRTTLPGDRPPVPEDIPASEITTIDRLTGPNVFRFQFRLAQNGMAVLVLDDPALPVEEPNEQPAETTTQ